MYIKLFEDWSIGYTFRDEGIKVIDGSDYQKSLNKDRFNSFEKKLLNDFVKNNRELVSDEEYKIDKWFTLKIKNIPDFPPIKLLIISLKHDIFNVRMTYYVKANRLNGEIDADTDDGSDLIFKDKQIYYQCDEIESVIRLLKKIIS